MFTIVKSSPELVSLTRTGNRKFWQCHIVKDKHSWYTQTSYWQINKKNVKSAVQWSDPYECTPKNVGRSNETTGEQQAELEFTSMLTKQQDKGYHEVGVPVVKIHRPMLAEKFKDRGDKIQWPAWVQPKYNGQRMLFNGTDGTSRGGKPIIPEVIAHLHFDTKGYVLDGELILPDNVLLQETMKATKKYRPGVSEQLLFIVYDIIIDDLPFSQRYKLLASMKNTFPSNVKLAPTHVVKNKTEVMSYHKTFTANGYEGTMVRDDSAGYASGQRSNQLLKYKDFVDAEFKIVDVVEGDGRFKGAAIFVCETDAGVTFNCMPEGTMVERRELFDTRQSHIDKYLTIRYQELSNDGVPLFPVGVYIRDKVDFS